MNLLLIDKHSDIESPVHRLDPLVKLLSFLGFVVVVVLLPKGAFVSLLAALATLLCVALVSRVPLSFLFHRTLVITPFVLLVGAINLLGRGLDLLPGWALGDDEHLTGAVVQTGLTWIETLSSVARGAGPGSAGVGPGSSGSGLVLVSFVTMVAKSVISVFSFTLLLSTTGSAKLLGAARRVGLPPVLTVATGFMLRYVFVLVDELSRLRRSWEARRVGRLHWLAEFRYLGSLIGVLLIKSYERAERVYLAMCSRGFDGFVAVQTHDSVPVTSVVFPILLLGPVLAAMLLQR
jgi:cobalt/nickel transport system permease protein